MKDILKLADPQGKAVNGNAALGTASEDKIAKGLELADLKKREKELEKNITDIKKLQADKDKLAAEKKESDKDSDGGSGGGKNKIAARKNSDFKAVSTAPSINKTPVGSATPPIPYPTTQDLGNSITTVPTVKLNGDPAYVLDQSKQPSCKGDDAGTAKGVKSGTVNGEVKPTKASGTVRMGKKPVVREGDACTMNGGNNPGLYVTTQTPSAEPPKSAEKTSNPPIKPETPKEQSKFSKWWDKTKSEMGQAVDNPWEGIKGAAKGIGNIPSDLAEMMAKGNALQQASDMEQAAALQAAFGQTKNASDMMELSAAMRENAANINVPKFTMNNAAQAGGDKISTGLQLLAGGAGLAKGGVGMVSKLGKAGSAVETVGNVGKTAEAAGALEGTAEAAGTAGKAAEAAKAPEVAKAAEAAPKPKPAGDGVKIIDKIKSLRQKYLGRTPGKNSRTGKEVQERMRAEGKLREDVVTGKTEFQASDGKWYPLEEADMAHKTDAVTWWNKTGREFGAKSPEVRNWMLDSKNYSLDHYSINRSLGAKLGETYLPPLK